MKKSIVGLFLSLFVVYGCKEKTKPEPQEPVAPKIEVVKPVEPVVEPVVEEATAEVDLNHKYFVVVNSYTVADFALDKCKFWRGKGYPAKVVMRNEDGYFRLVLSSRQEYRDALDACKELRQDQSEFKDAWVMYHSHKIEDKESH